ncbi:hypothetical protein P0Y31_01960 [Knoellia sp. 3-2P3]|uniref:hypothetical protein n=1 Tax=unclassified Knoellia TaxID=2618719 RepID=UPI0023DAF667|nr:hypothetical protein [Knoellia sp. 3-2P3]MDF2091093.1 hypothetical protein [Knoellia sp. 3-2P3]
MLHAATSQTFADESLIDAGIKQGRSIRRRRRAITSAGLGVTAAGCLFGGLLWSDVVSSSDQDASPAGPSSSALGQVTCTNPRHEAHTPEGLVGADAGSTSVRDQTWAFAEARGLTDRFPGLSTSWETGTTTAWSRIFDDEYRIKAVLQFESDAAGGNWVLATAEYC